MKIQFIIASILVITLLSCKKEKVEENIDIYRKWILLDTFHGYLNGGGHQWNPVSPNFSQYIEFHKDKTYIRTETGNSTRECLGTFELLDTDTLKLNTNCDVGVATSKVSELTSTTLIIDYQGKEGIIRERYRALK